MEDIKDMSDYELGVIAKAFVECRGCSTCPCDGILCGNKGWADQKGFVLEVAERWMKEKVIMNSCYVELCFSHKSFNTGKIAIVAIPSGVERLTTCVELAKERICRKLNLDEKEVVVLTYNVLGEDILFLN